MLACFTTRLSSSASPTTSQKRQRKEITDAFHKNLYDICQAEQEGGLIQVEFPAALVPKQCACAAHLFPKARHVDMPEWLDTADADTPANALLLFKCIQVAMDAGQIFFSYNASAQQYEMQLLDKSLCHETMRDAGNRMCYDFTALIPSRLAQTTWQELQDQALQFQGGHVPDERCMDFRARLAVLKAESEGWVPPGTVDIPDNPSESEYKERMRMFFDTMGPKQDPELF
ncbi:hypothetical protein WJX74_000284 [Apatococcus lobatus]|uniref:HNH nuclease domain-containing protein n=1 Tax=Apatococcus lobatus TaxID=904363 RepID=A0AAW1Q598_9CHLO